MCGSALETDLAEIAMRQATYFQSLTSGDYYYSELAPAGRGGPAFEVDSTPEANEHISLNRIRFQGMYWRGDLGLEQQGWSSKPTSEAYDGSHFQLYEEATRTLHTSEVEKFSLPFGAVPVSLLPFEFAYDTSKYNGHELLRDPEFWMDLFESNAAVLRSETSQYNNKPCRVLEMQAPPFRGVPKGEMVNRIYFSETQGSFPVRAELIRVLDQPNKERLLMAVTTEELTLIDTRGGSLYFPTKVNMRAWDESSGEISFDHVYTVDQSRCRINESLDHNDFALSALVADSLMNKDDNSKSMSLKVSLNNLLRDGPPGSATGGVAGDRVIAPSIATVVPMHKAVEPYSEVGNPGDGTAKGVFWAVAGVVLAGTCLFAVLRARARKSL